jgi:hypothetical protein
LKSINMDRSNSIKKHCCKQNLCAKEYINYNKRSITRSVDFSKEYKSWTLVFWINSCFVTFLVSRKRSAALRVRKTYWLTGSLKYCTQLITIRNFEEISTKKKRFLVFYFAYTASFLIPCFVFLYTISLTHPCGNADGLNSTKARIYNITIQISLGMSNNWRHKWWIM